MFSASSMWVCQRSQHQRWNVPPPTSRTSTNASSRM
jgi:hypothetical protein